MNSSTEFENTPLLEAEVLASSTLESDVKADYYPKNKSQRKTVCLVISLGLCLLVLTFSVSVHALVLLQYSYVAFQRMYFPNISLSESSFENDHCTMNSSSETYVYQTKIQGLTSQLTSYVTIFHSLPAIVLNLLFGSYSDSFGRKKFFVACLSGTLLKSVAYTLGVYYDVNLYLFVLFSFVEGCFGSVSSAVVLSFSYVADITNGRQRVLYLAVLQAMIGCGILVGSLSSGYQIQKFGFVLPNAVTCLLMFICVIMVITCLPESLKNGKNAKDIHVIEKLKDVVHFYIKDTSLQNRRWKFILMLSIIICMGLVNHGRTIVESLYQINSPFCWNSVLVGWSLALRMGCQFILGVALLKLLQLCIADEYIAILGASSCTASLIVEALTDSSIILLLVPVIGTGSMLTEPIVRGIMSGMTSADKQGALFAGIGMAEALCVMVGAIVFNNIYAATVGFYRGTVFFVFSGVSVLAILLLIVLKITKAGRREYQVLETETIKIDNEKDIPSS